MNSFNCIIVALCITATVTSERCLNNHKPGAEICFTNNKAGADMFEKLEARS